MSGTAGEIKVEGDFDEAFWVLAHRNSTRLRMFIQVKSNLPGHAVSQAVKMTLPAVAPRQKPHPLESPYQFQLDDHSSKPRQHIHPPGSSYTLSRFHRRSAPSAHAR